MRAVADAGRPVILPEKAPSPLLLELRRGPADAGRTRPTLGFARAPMGGRLLYVFGRSSNCTVSLFVGEPGL